MRRVLVTTAIEETWPDEEPILFLGEWCRRFSRRDQWSVLDSLVLDYHWDDSARFASDFRYLRDFYERLLEDLASGLNQLHHVDHSLRYWRILIGPWLTRFLAVLRDRWLSVERAIDEFDISWTTVLESVEEDFVPREYNDFVSLIARDDWNHFIYSTVLENFPQVDARRLMAGVTPASPSNYPRSARPATFKKRTVLALLHLGSRFIRKDSVVLFDSYLPPRDEAAVYLQLRQLPRFWHFLPPPKPEPADSVGHWRVPGSGVDPFEQFVRDVIPRQVPVVYAGGYLALQRVVEELPWPERPKLIFTSNAHFSNDVFKAWAAERVETGSRLVIGQHGGGWGTYRHHLSADHERAVGDAVLTWGEGTRTDSRVKPVGQIYGLKSLGVVHAEKEIAVLLTMVPMRQSYQGLSYPHPSQVPGCFEDQFEFVEALPEHIRSALLVRLDRSDYGWDQIDRWQERYPDIALDDAQGSVTFRDLVPRSRIVIANCRGTVYHESFAMGAPTIMFWNPDLWELHETEVAAHDDLVNAGILHYSPISAACKLADVWGDVDAWWSSRPIMAARERFCEAYNRSPSDLSRRVTEALREVMDLPPRS